jgi:hypothetical protein
VEFVAAGVGVVPWRWKRVKTKVVWHIEKEGGFMGQKLTFACALCILVLGSGYASDGGCGDVEKLATKKKLARNFLREVLSEDQFAEAAKFLAAA